MTFEPGKSGNPGGRPKHKPFQEALLMEAKAAERGDPCEALPGSLRWNARKLLEQGEVSSIKELADRLDGKVPQAIANDPDNPLPDNGAVAISDSLALIASALGGGASPASGKSGES